MSRDGAVSTATFTPGSGIFPAGGRATTVAARRPHRSRVKLKGTGRLGKVKSPRTFRVHPASLAKPLPGPKYLPPEGWQPPLPGSLSLGQYYVYPGEGRPPPASVNPQHVPGGPAALEEPSGIIHVECASSAIPPSEPDHSLPEGRRLSPQGLSTGRRFIPPEKIQLMLLRPPPGLELPTQEEELPSPSSWPLRQ